MTGQYLLAILLSLTHKAGKLSCTSSTRTGYPKVADCLDLFLLLISPDCKVKQVIILF